MKNRQNYFALLTAVAVAASACNNDSSPKPTEKDINKNVSGLVGGSSKPTDSKTPEAKPTTPETPVSTPPSGPDKLKPTSAPDAAPPKLTDDLKHSGADYYGLTNTKPVDFEVTTEGHKEDLTGARTFTLTKVENGKAYFKQTHSGGLAKAGEYELMVDKTGVYVMSSSTVQMDKPQLEIPADPKVGATWHTKNSIEDTDYTVVGFEKVKTPNGVRDSLLIKGLGTAKVNGTDVVTESKFWCVKGIGQVKCEFHTKPKAGQGVPQTVVMQESKKH